MRRRKQTHKQLGPKSEQRPMAKRADVEGLFAAAFLEQKDKMIARTSGPSDYALSGE